MTRQDPYLIDGQKLMYHPARVTQWQQARTPEEKLNVFPIYVEISPVGHCNHRCTFCAVDYIGYQTRRLATPVLCSVLDSMAKAGVKSVMFAGEGEPMLHPDIAQITRHAALAGLDVAFTTNGTALTEKFVNKALESCTWIKVSMNGGPKSYAKIHQTKEADYERVWANLVCAVAQRARWATRTAIGIQCVVLPDNLEDLPQLCQRAKDTGLDYIVLKPYSQHKSSHTHAYEGIKYDELSSRLANLQELSSDKFSVIVRTNAMGDWDAGEHRYHKCLATPYFWAYIMATGDVYSCSAYLLNRDFCLGNINDQAFRDIWTGPTRRAHLIKMENLDISHCRLNCRMNQVNKYLWDLTHANEHANFI